MSDILPCIRFESRGFFGNEWKRIEINVNNQIFQWVCRIWTISTKTTHKEFKFSNFISMNAENLTCFNSTQKTNEDIQYCKRFWWQTNSNTKYTKICVLWMFNRTTQVIVQNSWKKIYVFKLSKITDVFLVFTRKHYVGQKWFIKN